MVYARAKILSHMLSAPARHNRLCSGRGRCVLPIGIGFPLDLSVHHQYTMCKENRKKTNTAVSLFAYELILERSIWRYVYCRSPDGVINWIERYLRGRNVRTETCICETLMETHRVGRVPVAQLRHASHDKNVLLLDRDEPRTDGRTMEKNECTPRHMKSSRSRRTSPAPAAPSAACPSQCLAGRRAPRPLDVVQR
jgi:hypothetical protein